jgi:hypothetical protein
VVDYNRENFDVNIRWLMWNRIIGGNGGYLVKAKLVAGYQCLLPSLVLQLCCHHSLYSYMLDKRASKVIPLIAKTRRGERN